MSVARHRDLEAIGRHFYEPLVGPAAFAPSATSQWWIDGSDW